MTNAAEIDPTYESRPAFVKQWHGPRSSTPATAMLYNFFINPWMLLGLLGLSLPILAHLLSKRKYDVVHWGAMQFLELGRNARRRIRLEQLLLLLLRMGLIALIAIALARPSVNAFFGW